MTNDFFRFYLFCPGFACALNRGCLDVMYEEQPALLGTVLWIPYKAIKQFILEFLRNAIKILQTNEQLILHQNPQLPWTSSMTNLL